VFYKLNIVGKVELFVILKLIAEKSLR